MQLGKFQAIKKIIFKIVILNFLILSIFNNFFVTSCVIYDMIPQTCKKKLALMMSQY
jgi:hypothetical protein